MKISQSIIKEVMKINRGEQCPKQFEHISINKNYQPGGKAANLGSYFEYCMTGAIPKSGKAPMPDLLKSGKLSIDYQRASDRAKIHKDYISSLGFEIIETDHYLEEQIDGITCNGVLDIVAKRDNRLSIIDLKYSGLIGNKWETWGWHDETIQSNLHHLIQAHQYTILLSENMGINATEIDFYFYVVGSGAKDQVKIYKININSYGIFQHLELIKDTYADLQDMNFAANGSFSMCADCPLFDSCKGAVKLPDIIEVDL